MDSDRIVVETYLSTKPERSSSNAGLASVATTFLASIIYWENWHQLAHWLPASGESVFQQKQYWRLVTGILVHSDFMHFLSNAKNFATQSNDRRGMRFFNAEIVEIRREPAGLKN